MYGIVNLCLLFSSLCRSHTAAQHVKRKTGQDINQASYHMYQIFEQLMIDFDFQLALRTRSKRKLSGVLSVGNAFKSIPCEIARSSSEIPSVFQRRLQNIVPYKFSLLLLL